MVDLIRKPRVLQDDDDDDEDEEGRSKKKDQSIWANKLAAGADASEAVVVVVKKEEPVVPNAPAGALIDRKRAIFSVRAKQEAFTPFQAPSLAALTSLRICEDRVLARRPVPSPPQDPEEQR